MAHLVEEAAGRHVGGRPTGGADSEVRRRQVERGVHLGVELHHVVHRGEEVVAYNPLHHLNYG